MALIVLEEQLQLRRADTHSATDTAPPPPPPPPPGPATVSATSVGRSHSRASREQLQSSRFVAGLPVCAQPLFAGALLRSLRQPATRHLHRHWLWLFTSALPYLQSRKCHQLVLHVLLQLVTCVEQVAVLYTTSATSTATTTATITSNHRQQQQQQLAPPDYMLLLLEAVTVACHYCLLAKPGAGCGGGGSAALMHTYLPGSSASQVLANLMSALVPVGVYSTSTPPATATASSASSSSDVPTTPTAAAGGGGGGGGIRPLLLAHFHHVLDGLLSAWHATTSSTTSSSSSSSSGCGEPAHHWSWVAGAPAAVRAHIVQLLAPLAVEHCDALLLAAAHVWHSRWRHQQHHHHHHQDRWRSWRHLLAEPCTDQLQLLHMLHSLGVLSGPLVMKSVRRLLRKYHHQQLLTPAAPAAASSSTTATTTAAGVLSEPIRQSHAIALLQLLLSYMRHQLPAAQQLVECWPELLQLVRDKVQQQQLPGQRGTAPQLLLLLAALAEFAQRAPPLLPRRDLREVQDACSRLVEACAAVAGACLGATTWLRRSLAVRTAPELSPPNGDDDNDPPPLPPPPPPLSSLSLGTTATATASGTSNNSSNNSNINVDTDEPDLLWNRSDRNRTPAAVSSAAAAVPVSASSSTPAAAAAAADDDVQWSVHTLRALAELLAPTLDLLYQSDEKERSLPLLTALMYRVTPYLRHHGSANVPAHLAASQLLASLSEYPFSRRAWRREALDLLLEPAFFSMDRRCLTHWRTVVDNLMTHDRTTFKELLARAVAPAAGSLGLFASRDLELEQRCQLLKRLAFVVYCSPADQFQPYMPDIQEKLKESLRVQQPCAQPVQAAVLLCFRVLLLRMSPHYMVWLWPIIVTETAQALLSAEERLLAAVATLSGGDCGGGGGGESASATVADQSSVNGSAAEGGGGGVWLQLQLQACRLLQLCFLLPSHRLPQFQMYRWAFVAAAPEPTAAVDVTSVTAATATTANCSADAQQQQQQLQSAGGGGGGGEFVPHVTRLARLAEQLQTIVAASSTSGGGAGSGSGGAGSSSDQTDAGRSRQLRTGQQLLARAAGECSDEELLQQLCPVLRQLAGQALRCSHLPEQQVAQHVETMLEEDFLEPLQPGL